MLNFTELEQVKNFAQKRSVGHVTTTLPMEHKCTDSRVSLLPGDDLYHNPDGTTSMISIDKSAKEFRSGVKNIHRIEFYDMNDVVLQLNFELPHGHISPVNANPKKHD